MLQVWQVVFNTQHHASPHEPRVRNGEEDSVQVVLQEVPKKVEPRTASEKDPS